VGGPGAVNAAAVSHLPARPRRDHVREIPEAGLLFDIRQMIEDGAGLRLRHHLPRDAEEKMGAFVLPRLTGRAPAHQPGRPCPEGLRRLACHRSRNGLYGLER
jgi:hypothetical protein